MIYNCKGDLLKSDANIICHQVNCQGAMNSGVARSVRIKWPKVYTEYKEKCNNAAPNTLLGSTQFVIINEYTIVANMFAQLNYGYDGRCYTSYDAFCSCLLEIKKAAEEYEKLNNEFCEIAFPKNIGCCRGGANWNIIYKMIEEVLGDLEVYIYEL